jgi:hypothetical protein
LTLPLAVSAVFLTLSSALIVLPLFAGGTGSLR